MINIINKLFLDNKYIILVYLIFILCFLSLWNFDNINTKYIEYFDNPECPKKYSDTLLKIAKSDGKVNRNIHDIDTDYELNSIDIKKNRSGAALYRGKYPRESNYDFSIKKKSKK
jgi:hypothetical protein